MKHKQSDDSLDVELSEFQQEPDDESDGEEEVVVSNASSRPGRRPIPVSWSSVISLDLDEPLKLNIQTLESSFLLAAAERDVPPERRDKQWAPIFCPKLFCKDNETVDTGAFKLSTP
jgi:hypothetical protein